jgi:glycosyltransferase involved in cell wall biosynthesis
VSGVRIIQLLGRRDHPTDGVADYCDNLREFGPAQGLAFESVEVRWAEQGWRRALAELRDAATAWRDRWVLLQYTTLAWSQRGFPLRAPSVLDVLRQTGVRCGVVFHDFVPWHGRGFIGSVRQACQLHVLRQLHARADVAIFPGQIENILWLANDRDKAKFIPVGANCPELPGGARITALDEVSRNKTIAVYGVTGGANTLPEVADIAFAVKQARATGCSVDLVVFGRGSAEAEVALRSALADIDVGIETLGLISPTQVRQALARADVLLFVRGQISSRRGSAIAGIASGLPIVCYSGPETVWPVTEAGILAAPMGDRQALAIMLRSVLTDEGLRSCLRERSRRAHERHFSWAAITASYAATFGEDVTAEEVNLTKKLSGERQVA